MLAELESAKEEENLAYKELREKRLSLDFLKCDKCDSRINSKKIEKIDIEKAVRDYLNETSTLFPSGTCPVCNESGLSLPKREMKNLLSVILKRMTLKKKIEDVQAEIKEEFQEDDCCWVAFGWAAS